MNIIPALGAPLKKSKQGYVFVGGKQLDQNKGRSTEQAKMGLYLTSQQFNGGEIWATFNHQLIDEYSCSELVIAYDPESKDSVHVGIPRDNQMVSVRHWTKGKWEYIASSGDREALSPKTDYKIFCSVAGSQISVFINDVKLIQTNLPIPLAATQFGLFFIGSGEIEVKDIRVTNTQPKAFVIMEFSSQYNDVYTEVIKSVCTETNIEVMRVDERRGPGLIITDIVQSIEKAAFVIADISPLNANVFYEVGYAHGINKPTILMAETGTKLPFDVSPFRTIFYDNSISGKSRLEQGLREHIRAILGS